MKANCLIIGAMKAATTSLHEYLSRHPQCQMSRPKEINFFGKNTYRQRGVRWYDSHFGAKDKIVWGEASTSYSNWPAVRDVPLDVHEYNPAMRLIYVLRDPIDRFVSHYLHNRNAGCESRSISEVVNALRQDGASRYLMQSKYAEQLAQYLKYFSHDQILLVTTEQLKADRDTVLLRVIRYLRIPESDQFLHSCKGESHSSAHFVDRRPLSKLVIPQWFLEHPRIPWGLKSPIYHLARIGGTPIAKPELSESDLQVLRSLFCDDVGRLSRNFDVDLAGWRAYN
jgi:hypothetical protein